MVPSKATLDSCGALPAPESESTLQAAFVAPHAQDELLPLPDIGGHSNLANHLHAERFRQVLEGDLEDHPAPPPPSPFRTSTYPVSKKRHGPSHGKKHGQLLSDAFKREHSVTANERRKRAYNTMYTEEKERSVMRHLSKQVAVDTAKTTAESSTYRTSKKTKMLDGWKGASARAEPAFSAQQLGIGVIGSQAHSNGISSSYTADTGPGVTCDILVPDVVTDWRARKIEGDSRKIMLGPYFVSLECDLPPLAAEHPARVWNSILHSLPQDLVPVVEWKHERIEDEDEDLPIKYICAVTLSLPLCHPSLTAHPSLTLLPENLHPPDCIAAATDIGPAATNSALLKVILGNAVCWLHQREPGSEHETLEIDEDQVVAGAATGALPMPPSHVESLSTLASKIQASDDTRPASTTAGTLLYPPSHVSLKGDELSFTTSPDQLITASLRPA